MPERPPALHARSILDAADRVDSPHSDGFSASERDVGTADHVLPLPEIFPSLIRSSSRRYFCIFSKRTDLSEPPSCLLTEAGGSPQILQKIIYSTCKIFFWSYIRVWCIIPEEPAACAFLLRNRSQMPAGIPWRLPGNESSLSVP